MTKKERLKAQKEKQLKLEKEYEAHEQNLAAKSKRKTVHSRKGAKYLKETEPAVMKVLKIVMLLPFLWSGVFWGLITAFGIKFGYIFGEDYLSVGQDVARNLLLGDALILVGIVFSFLKKYIVCFAFSLFGAIVYNSGANQIISGLKKFFASNYAENDSGQSLENLPQVYMIRHYPIFAVAAIALVLMLISVISAAVKRRKQKEIADNAPVKSIID